MFDKITGEKKILEILHEMFQSILNGNVIKARSTLGFLALEPKKTEKKNGTR